MAALLQSETKQKQHVTQIVLPLDDMKRGPLLNTCQEGHGIVRNFVMATINTKYRFKTKQNVKCFLVHKLCFKQKIR